MALDSGYKGSIMSLSGLRSRPGYGLQTYRVDSLISSSIPITLLLPARPQRVYAIIQNHDNVNSLQVYFGESEQNMYLYPGDAWIIDRDHPWSGSIHAIGSSGDAYTIATDVFLAGPVM